MRKKIVAVAMLFVSASWLCGTEPDFHIPFDGSGDAILKDGKKTKGIIHGKTIYDNGIAGQALIVKRHAYDQVTCYNLKDLPPVNYSQGTIAFWFRPFWGFDDKKHDLFRIKVPGSKFRIYLVKNKKSSLDYSVCSPKQSQIIKKCEFKAKQWYHITMTWHLKNGSTALYVDGKLLGKKLAPEGKLIIPKNWGSAELWLGQASANNFNAVVGDGLYDDFKIFSKALTLAEIQELTFSEAADKEEKELALSDSKPVSAMPAMDLPGVNDAGIVLFKGSSKSQTYFDKNGEVKSFSCWFKLKKKKYNSPVQIFAIDASKTNLLFSSMGMNGYVSVKAGRGADSLVCTAKYPLTLDSLHHILVNIDSGKLKVYLDGALQADKGFADDSIGSIKQIKLGGQLAEIADLLALNKAYPQDSLPALLKNEKKLDGLANLTINKLSKLEQKIWSLDDAPKRQEGVRQGICLNGIWRVVPTNEYSIYPPTASWGLIRVPGSFRSPLFQIYKEKNGEMVSLNWQWKKKRLLAYRAAWYQRAFVVPKTMNGKNIFINFKNIVADYARIYVNGTLAYSFVNDSPSYSSIPNRIRLDISKYLTQGENTLTLFVDRRYSKLWRGHPSINDHGEIALDDVWLESGPSSVQVVTVLALPSFREKEVLFKLKILNPEGIKGEAKVKLGFSYKGRSEKEFEKEIILNGEPEEKIQFKMPWSNPKLWNEETPNLYKLTLSIYDNKGKLLDSAAPVDFGFREFWVENGEFYLNGKEARLRMWSSPGISRVRYYYGTPKGIRQYIANLKRIGYNSTRCHPILGLESQVSWENKFSESDKQGFYHLQPVPPYEGTVSLDRYDKHIEKYIDAFGNHPSIIMWYTDFNTCSYPWNQDPAKLNDTEYVPENKISSIKLAKAVEKVIKKHDPLRETFQHAGGNSGRIFGSMNYQSLGVPLQEREDWPKQWSEKHTQPLMVVECGFPYPSQFKHFKLDPRRGVPIYKGQKAQNIFLVAEHAARYFGDDAFKNARSPSCFIAYTGPQLANWPDNYVNVKNLLMGNTVKAWRAYGVSALGHFPGARDHYEQFGTVNRANVVYEIRDDVKNPGLKPDRIGTSSEVHRHRLSDYTKPTTMFKTLQDSFSPLLVFLGGSPENFTNKDHAFYSGEKFNKSVVVVNDKFSDQELIFKLKFINKTDGKVLMEREFTEVVGSGKIKKFPIEMKTPNVYKRIDAELKMDVIQNGRLIGEDSMQIQFFPKHVPADFKNTEVALYDPFGQTEKMLKEAGLPFVKVNKFSELKNKTLLIIGKNVLGRTPPDFLRELDSSNMIKNGFKILIFEQKQCNLGNLVFERPSQRIAFVRKNGHPAIEGLKNEDFRNWRGGTDTVPEFVISKEISPHYPRSKWKCGNDGIVAGHVIRKPQYGNFTPILDCGFNLMNSPLLELQRGRGIIVFCQLDATHRYLKDPVATELIDNLLKYMSSPFVPIKSVRTAYVGGEIDAKLLDRMGAKYKRFRYFKYARDIMANHVLIVGKGDSKILQGKNKKEFIKKFVHSGGCIFMMPGSDLSILPFKVQTEEEDVFKVILPENDPVFSGIPNADLYFRYLKKLPVIVKTPRWTIKSNPAVIGKIDYGRGSIVIFNIDPNTVGGLWNKEKILRVMSKILANMKVGLAKDYKFFAGDKYRHNQIGNPSVIPDNWEFRTDPKNIGDKDKWFKDIYSVKGFRSMTVPGYWETFGIRKKNPDYKYPPKTPRALIHPYDGYAWYRVKFVLPEKWKGLKVYFDIDGAIDDNDWTYVNGKLIGKTTFAENPRAYAVKRRYEIPAELLNFGKENTIAIRVFDKWGLGGINGEVSIEAEKGIAKDSWSPYMDDLDFYDVDAFHNW